MEGNGMTSFDKTHLSRKEAEEAEEKATHTPEKVPKRPVENAQSGMVTRSAKKIRAARGSGPKALRSASWHADSDKVREALTHRSHKKVAAETRISEVYNSEIEKMIEHVGKRHTNNTADSNEGNKGSHGGVSSEKKRVDTPQPGETENPKADKYTDRSIPEALSQSPRYGGQNVGNRNIKQKEICNEDFGEENISFGREESDEEKRRRIRLSHILESSGLKPDIREREGGVTQTAGNPSPLKDTVTYVSSADCAMIVGDGQEDPAMTKTFQTQDTKNMDRALKTEDSQLSETTDGNLEAGGDASAIPGIPPYANKTSVFRHTSSQCIDKSLRFRELAPESAQPHQMITPSEKVPKRAPIQKGELDFQADPSGIPLKPVPVMNEGGVGENESAEDSLSAVTYMNPEISLLYQPEAGVMKSKPVPKPTRGRRSRRRSPSALTGFPEYRPFVTHPEIRFPEQARFITGHPYQRYMLPEFAHGLSADCCDVVPGHGGFVTTYQADTPREVLGASEESIAPAYPANRWYCKDDFFKVPRPTYAAAQRSRGRGSSRGRPRGRRGSGGVRQYLQHRLLWARYTGRSQEALDRVLSIINSKCGLQEEAPKEAAPARLWTVAGSGGSSLDAAALAGVEVPAEELYGRLDSRDGGPTDHPAPPYSPLEDSRPEPDNYTSPYYRPPTFSSNISNMMSGGSSSNSSLLSQSGIASNAVVDGNGYIVYLNQDDNTDFQHQPPIPFLPSDSASLTDTGDPAAIADRPPPRGAEVKAENDVRKSDDLSQPDPAGDGGETASIGQNKPLGEGMPSHSSALAESGATGETAALAAMPLESSLASSLSDSYAHKDSGKRLTARKAGTPKSSGVKTPVSPVKEPKASKRHCQTSGGRQKKKVRRSLTFCSPIKQEETLRATENIANALTNTGSEDEASATCSVSTSPDFLPSSTCLPSISNLLHSSTSAGISINIHVTNDANKERTAPRPSSEDVGTGSRLLPGALEQGTAKAAARAEVPSRPGEGAPLVHCPVPRYTVEWHGDYQQEAGDLPGDRGHRYQDHMLPLPLAPNTAAARFRCLSSWSRPTSGSSCTCGAVSSRRREGGGETAQLSFAFKSPVLVCQTSRYPYRDPSSSHGYYPQQRPYPGPGTPVDRYYTSDYAKEWTEAYAKYPPDHFLTSYDLQPPSMPAPYPSVQWGAGWNRSPDMFMEPPYHRHPGSRGALDMDMADVAIMRDLPYHPFPPPAAAPYCRTQGQFAEEGYSQLCPPYSAYRSCPTGGHHGKDRLLPDGVHEGKPPEDDYHSHRLQQTWAVAGSGVAGPQVALEGCGEQLGPEARSPGQLQPSGGGSVLQPAQVDPGNTAAQIPQDLHP